MQPNIEMVQRQHELNRVQPKGKLSPKWQAADKHSDQQCSESVLLSGCQLRFDIRLPKLSGFFPIVPTIIIPAARTDMTIAPVLHQVF